MPGVEPMPPVLEPVEAPPLVEPLPSEPVLPEVLPEAPAPVVLEPSSFRHCSFCVPVRESQRVEPTPLAPADEEPMLLPVAPVEGEVVLLEPVEGEPVLLEPTDGELELLLPVLIAPVLPLVPAELCAKAPDMANSAAAVAETTSFKFICAPLGGWNELELRGPDTQGPCRQPPVS